MAATGETNKPEPGISRDIFFASAMGVAVSFSPHISNVGAEIRGRQSVRSSFTTFDSMRRIIGEAPA